MTVHAESCATLPSRFSLPQAQLPTLLSDATLAAAAVVYGGLLPSSERRAEALEAWRGLLEAAGLPVRPGTFDFGAFMEIRQGQLLAGVPPLVQAAAERWVWEVKFCCFPPLSVLAGPCLLASHRLCRRRLEGRS